MAAAASGAGELRPPPEVFAAVMATGIVSIAAADHGQRWISGGLAAVAAVMLPMLVVLAAVGWKRAPLDYSDVDVVVRLFTYVAACAVLAARFAGTWAAWLLAGLAVQAWLSLMPALVSRMRRAGWAGLRARARGTWELAGVATSGLAIAFAELRVVFLAALFWGLGILVYGVITTLIVQRIVRERLDHEGLEPDCWILMGGLAIATLAGVHVHALWHSPVIAAVTVVTWLVATLWIPPLACLSLRLRRELSPAAWWAMVFPLGMYSSATFAMAGEVRLSWLGMVSLVFFWTALAAWFTTVVRLVAHSRR